MVAWEYRRLDLRSDDMRFAAEHLAEINRHGSEGWEVCHIGPNPDRHGVPVGFLVVMKRPAQNGPRTS